MFLQRIASSAAIISILFSKNEICMDKESIFSINIAIIAKNTKLAGDCIPKISAILNDILGKLPSNASITEKQIQYSASSCFTPFFLILRKTHTAVTTDEINSIVLNVVLILLSSLSAAYFSSLSSRSSVLPTFYHSNIVPVKLQQHFETIPCAPTEKPTH